MKPRSVAVALVVLAAVSGCRVGPEVARLSNGRDVSGRWIHPDAYAAFLDGALAEAHGDLARAAASYRRTIAEDPDAAEAWARLGAVLCTSAPREAEHAFARAGALAPGLEESHRAPAVCFLRRGEPGRAVVPAERALAAEPDDPEATETLATALERSGNAPRAAALRRALALYLRAPGPPETASGALESALFREDTRAVRDAGRAAHLADSDVAFEALAAGRPAIAARVADLALASDPGNTSARVAALASADLARDDAAFVRALRPLPKDRVDPTAPAVTVLRDLLLRRSGTEAANLVVTSPEVPAR